MLIVNSASSRPLVFISHIHEEKELADIVAGKLQSDYLNMLRIFRSTDMKSIGAGSKWLDDIDRALANSAVILALCSPESVMRPWINFECGAGWMKQIPIVPVCHSGLSPRDLPIPLKLLQGINASTASDWESVYLTLANALGSDVPTSDFASLAGEIADFEVQYTLLEKVRKNVRSLMDTNSAFKQMFPPGSPYGSLKGEVLDDDLKSIEPALTELQDLGVISYSKKYIGIAIGEDRGGNQYSLSVSLTGRYHEIAERVFGEMASY